MLKLLKTIFVFSTFLETITLESKNFIQSKKFLRLTTPTNVLWPGQCVALFYINITFLIFYFLRGVGMNLKNNPTIEELAALIRPLDDQNYSHKMWVDYDGDVHISIVPENEEKIHAKSKFRYECLDRGNGYVGPKAANDEEYVEKELEYLKRDWARGAEGYIDF